MEIDDYYCKKWNIFMDMKTTHWLMYNVHYTYTNIFYNSCIQNYYQISNENLVKSIDYLLLL